MISHLLTTKNTKESKKHCHKSHFTKERPVLSKITKNIVAAFHFWQKIGEKSQRISFRCFRQNVYVLWFLHITCAFSCFLLISLLISSTLFTTTKYTFFKWKSPCFHPQFIRLFYHPTPSGYKKIYTFVWMQLVLNYEQSSHSLVIDTTYK